MISEPNRIYFDYSRKTIQLYEAKNGTGYINQEPVHFNDFMKIKHYQIHNVSFYPQINTFHIWYEDMSNKK